MTRKTPLAALLLLPPLPALAHPGDHGATGIAHALTEPDHLALLAGVVVLALYGIVKLRSRR